MKFVEAVGNEPKLMNYNAVTRQLDNRDPLKPRSPLLPNDWKIVIGDDDLDTLCIEEVTASCQSIMVADILIVFD